MKPLIALVLLAAIAACSPQLPSRVTKEALNREVGLAVGDPGTCVVLAEAKTGKVIWESAKSYVCARSLPACTAPGETTVSTLAKAAAGGAVVQTGCANVTWAAGPTPRAGLVYAAVMQGSRALPGMEIALRLDGAFERAGL